MNEFDNLINQYNDLTKERIELEIKRYQLLYPNENFMIPNIIPSLNFHHDAIKIYQQQGFSDDYIEELESRANWNTTCALTIHNSNMKYAPIILVNVLLWKDDTIIHELTHVSDYYEYIKSIDGDLLYMDFLDSEDFLPVYLFSEFRAFYRGSLNSDEDLYNRMKFEQSIFKEEQEKAIKEQQLEAYYHSVKYVAMFIALMQKELTDEQINDIMNSDDDNLIHKLIKFLFPLRNKSFVELIENFTSFHDLLDSFIIR